MTDIIERLRTDYDILKNDYDAQRAEIERLRAAVPTEIAKGTYALAAEITRLRAALQRIADDGKNCDEHCRRQARRALEHKP